MGIVQLCLFPQGTECSLAEIRHGNALARIVCRASRGTFQQKAGTPFPLQLFCTKTIKKRGIFLAQPFQDFRRGRRVCPGLRMGNGNLGAVSESGFLRSAGRRSITVTSCPACRRNHAAAVPVIPDPNTMTFTI